VIEEVLESLPREKTPESGSLAAEVVYHIILNFLPEDRELLEIRHSLGRGGKKEDEYRVRVHLEKLERPDSDSAFILPVGRLLSDLTKNIKKLRPNWQEWAVEDSE
jgi:hypothetical protein